MLIVGFLYYLATGCVTSSNSVSDDLTGNENGDPTLEGDDNVPAAKDNRLAPGPIEDVDMKELVYQGVEKQLSASDTEQSKVEIGDFESYKFAIIKMTKSSEDVTSLASESPDRLIVEVSGWYKRSAKSDDETDDKCFSFEANVHLNEDGDNWTYDDKDPLTFNRENSEDCY